MKKIFILTGEASGDKLASEVILNLKKINSEIDSFDDILEIIDTKIISIGSNKYLALIKVNYEDTLTDPEIIDLNQSIEAKIKNVDSRFSHLYIIPA